MRNGGQSTQPARDFHQPASAYASEAKGLASHPQQLDQDSNREQLLRALR